MIYDVAVIGGGPGGVAAAVETARRGLKTVLVEMGFLGGACLNCGCIPTKLLLGNTACQGLLGALKLRRAASGGVSFDLAAMQEDKKRYLTDAREDMARRLAGAGVELLRGRASFGGPKSLNVKTESGVEELRFTHCIVAAGSAPAFFPGLKPDGESILSSTSLLGTSSVPRSLIIVGGGFIGLELGGIFHSLETRITMVEALPRIAAQEDEEVSAALRAYYERNGWIIITGRRVSSLVTEQGGSVLTFADGETVRAEKSLVAVGRQFPTAQLNAAVAGIELEKRGTIRTDECLQAADGIYAVGDVNGRVLLSHAADHQARYVAARIAGETAEPYGYAAMPSCIYGHMEVMRVGPTAEALRQAGHRVFVSRSQLNDNVISHGCGDPCGFVKTAWVNGTIRSVTAFGHGVSHLVTPATIMVANKWRQGDINNIIFAHPTLDEALKSAILAMQILLE